MSRDLHVLTDSKLYTQAVKLHNVTRYRIFVKRHKSPLNVQVMYITITASNTTHGRICLPAQRRLEQVSLLPAYISATYCCLLGRQNIHIK